MRTQARLASNESSLTHFLIEGQASVNSFLHSRVRVVPETPKKFSQTSEILARTLVQVDLETREAT